MSKPVADWVEVLECEAIDDRRADDWIEELKQAWSDRRETEEATEEATEETSRFSQCAYCAAFCGVG